MTPILIASFVIRFDPSHGRPRDRSGWDDRINGPTFSTDVVMLDHQRTRLEPHNVLAFEVSQDGRSIDRSREFAHVRPGTADGFRCEMWRAMSGPCERRWNSSLHSASAAPLEYAQVPEQRDANSMLRCHRFPHALYRCRHLPLLGPKLA